MTSHLCYKTRGEVADITAFTIGGRELIISVSDAKEGHITIGDLTVPLSEGEARIPPHRLSDGEYRPILITRNGLTRLERFAISGGRLAILPTEEGRIRELISRVRELELRLDSYENRFSELGRKISEETIF